MEDICRVRIRLFTLPVTPRDAPVTVRLHMCPELPDRIEAGMISRLLQVKS